MLTLDLRFPYDDERTAKAVLAAVAPENGGYVEARIEGPVVYYHIEAGNARILKNTADDLLACIKAAEESAGLAPGPCAESGEGPERTVSVFGSGALPADWPERDRGAEHRVAIEAAVRIA